LNVGGDQIKRKAICSVILLLGFALILNVNASSAATVNGTSSVNTSIKSDLSTNMTNPVNSISANNSKASTNSKVSTTTNSVTTTKVSATTAVKSNTDLNASTTVKTTTTEAAAKVNTKTAPKVVNTTPTNKAVKVAQNKAIKITFSEPIKFASKDPWITVQSSTSKYPVILSKTISGNVLTLTPKTPLGIGSSYKVTIHGYSLYDLFGNALKSDYTFQFLTQTVQLKITNIDPAKYSVNVPINGKFVAITFNEPIKIQKPGWIEIVDSQGKVIPTTKTLNGNTLAIRFTTPLSNGMTYSVKLHGTSITDLAGTNFYSFVTKFTTVSKTPVLSAALSPYLLPSANCQSNDPKIIALAKSITKGSTSQYTSAVKIFNWVRDNINYAFYYNTQKGALGTLSSRSANCADTAHLMVALERAAGIPARYEHINAQFSSGNWYGHVVAQVYVNGKWYYADGTSYRNSFGVIKNWNTSTFILEGVYRSLPF
jgi:transglutaminase-like putative cysteine protease